MLGDTQLYYFQPYTENGEDALKKFIEKHPDCKAHVFYAPQVMHSFLAPGQLTIAFEIKNKKGE